MDKIYLRKLLKTAFAIPLAFSVALVLDIDPGLSFFGSLFVFNTIWSYPDPIGLKGLFMLKQLMLFLLMLFTGAFVAGLWGVNSIVLFFFILLTGWGIQTWMPSAISLGIIHFEMFLTTSVLNSSAPYRTAVYMFVLIGISLGLGWLVERLFWPIFAQQGIERQVSQTFRIFEDFSKHAFHRTDVSSDLDDNSISALTAQAGRLIRASHKALKTAAMTSGLTPSERDNWAEALALQARLMAHLLAISGLLEKNRENALLHELTPELSALGNSLSATFAELSVAIITKKQRIQLLSPNSELKNWQTRLTEMRRAGVTKSYKLANRLAVGLIEHRLEGLISDTSKILSWLNQYCSVLPKDLPSELERAQS